jgi:heat shock protein HslJ
VISRATSASAVAAMLALAACVPPPGQPPASPAPVVYRALGQEPGWSLEITGGRLLYLGDYGTVRIVMRAPEPRATFNGHRYEAREGGHSLTVDVTHSLCHDGMSGRAFADTVMVTADSREVRGCGGERVPAQDV